ncbi:MULTISPECIES: hypothetical protein [unclassified Delftia]|uniref:hypothetical protein n=1 Tax=unclassified Delftia TaxID=2613839 RepID=UPI0012E089AC|nr:MULTISPECIES: hypothetical protein [unclassified Delftia]
MSKVIFETISGDGGTGHYISDHRCGGVKPLGGGRLTQRAELNPKEVIAALEMSTAGRAALATYVKRFQERKES